MIGKPGPFQIIGNDGSGNVDAPMQAPRRRFTCEHYETCLSICAAMNWDNFTCRGCSGDVCENMLWRAHQARRRDNVAKELCEIPNINCIADQGEIQSEDVLKAS